MAVGVAVVAIPLAHLGGVSAGDEGGTTATDNRPAMIILMSDVGRLPYAIKRQDQRRGAR